MAEKISLFLLVGLIGLMALVAYFLSYVSGFNKVLVIILVYVTLAAIIVFTKLTIDSIGLNPKSIISGVKYVLPFLAIIFIGGLIAYFVSPNIFKDSRYNLTSKEVLFTIFVIIPFVTVILEELVFRGVIFGLLQLYLPQIYAVFLSSLCFGLWHFFTAKAVNLPFNTPKFFTVFVIILATTLAGIFFTWLRIKSNSLIAPILVHWMINSTGVFLAYLAWKT